MSTEDAGWHVRTKGEQEKGEVRARQAAFGTLEVDPEDRALARAAFFDGWDAHACWKERNQ